MFQVFKDNICIKEYPFKLQAIMYCMMHGYVYSGLGDWNFESIIMLDPCVQIKERE